MRPAAHSPTLTPKLRFPEFRNAPGWEEKRLEDVAPLQRGFDLPSDLIRPGRIPVVYSNGIQKLHEVGMATAPGLVTGRSGTIVKLHFIEEGEYWPHNTSLWVTDFMENIPRFIYYLYDSIGMSRFSSGSGVPTLNRNDVHAFISPVPQSPAEQHKIASCLSSLDDLIAAERQKLDALKAHKKGLMQHLFPREGETRPRLRFPEFRDAGEWRKRTISEIPAKVSIPVEVEIDVTYREIGVRSHGKGIFHKEPISGQTLGNKRVFQVVENALVLNIVFAWEQAVATTSQAENGMIASHRFPMYITQSGACDVRFMKLTFLTPQGKHLLAVASPRGAGRNRTLGQIEFERLTVLLPDMDEQTMIAKTILTIDDLIAAQSDKLEALTTHKKWLM
jgi:type I restriction enzyme S subunit